MYEILRHFHHSVFISKGIGLKSCEMDVAVYINLKIVLDI